MTEIFDFPTLPVSKQIFHVPGAAVEGGYTSGAVRILSPEPGGRSVLEMQIALQVREWDYPMSSWLMSKGNGEVFRVRLAPTPQVLQYRPGVQWDHLQPWSNHQPWAGDITAYFTQNALEGSTVLKVDMTGYGDVIRLGHVIGYGDSTHVIDRLSYDAGIATLTVKPPLRRNVVAGEQAFFRPFFTGTIGNIDEMRATYDADQNGAIQIGKIVFLEAIV